MGGPASMWEDEAQFLYTPKVPKISPDIFFLAFCLRSRFTCYLLIQIAIVVAIYVVVTVVSNHPYF